MTITDKKHQPNVLSFIIFIIFINNLSIFLVIVMAVNIDTAIPIARLLRSL